MTTTDNDYLYIDSDARLQDYCATLQHCSRVSIDTEFIRERTYRPELCLIQINSGDKLALIDTIAIRNLEPLAAVLYNDNILKVFHSGTQDLEIFYWQFGRVPAPLFDTQIAAPLLGHQEQMGYGNLVREVLNIELPKAHTRADWSARPLSESQLRYALDDVVYLHQLHESLVAELSARNRLDWLAPEFDSLTDASRYDRPPEDAWKRINAARKLKGQALSCLQSLAVWREYTAREQNLPRNWVVKDDILVAIARLSPKNRKELESIRGLNRRFLATHADAVIEQVLNAEKKEPEPLPAFAKKQKPTPMQRAIRHYMEALVALHASELDINPEILMPAKLIEACAAAGDSTPLTGWRQALLSADVNKLLGGDLLMQIDNNQLVRVDSDQVR